MDLQSARELACNLVRPKGAEWVPLDQALGRVLAESLTAARDLPGEPRSRMDGYALRSSDATGLMGDPTVLRLTEGCAAAGHVVAQPVIAGECLRILTGAPLPPGADAVVPQEVVELRDGALAVQHAVHAGQWVMQPGADVAAKERVLEAGVVLTPTALALAAALGNTGLGVHQRPRVALLATGDELLELGETRPGPHYTCNNRYLLGWMTRLQGGLPAHLGVARDDPAEIEAKLTDTDADLVITTGGIGHGDRDFVPRVWENLGVMVHFRQINLSPGRYSALGSKGRQIFCALPGNPWAAQVVFSEIVGPMLRRWQGLSIRQIPMLPARLASSIRNSSGLYRAIRGALHNHEGTLVFQPQHSRAVSLFRQVQASQVYTLIPPNVEEMPSGSAVRVAWFDGPLMALAPWVESAIRPALE
jgi:molybdopterin molybdotransferase